MVCNDRFESMVLTGHTFILQGITAILNFQGGTEAQNWGIDSQKINDACQKSEVLMINYPIKYAKSYRLQANHVLSCFLFLAL